MAPLRIAHPDSARKRFTPGGRPMDRIVNRPFFSPDTLLIGAAILLGAWAVSEILARVFFSLLF